MQFLEHVRYIAVVNGKYKSINHPLDAFPKASYLKQMQSWLGLQKVFVTITMFRESHL